MTIGDKTPEILGTDHVGNEIRSSIRHGRKSVLCSHPEANADGCMAEAFFSMILNYISTN